MDYYAIKKQYPMGSNLAIVFVLFAGVLVISIWSSSLSNINQLQSLPNQNSTILVSDELEKALSKASMSENNNNKAVIIAVINRAYVDQTMQNDKTMLDIFLDSLWLGEGTKRLRDNLLLVAVDRTAYDRCEYLRMNCYRLETDGVDFTGEKVYMSTDFIRMMWTRTSFLLEVLKRGYSFIFTDTDVVWLRDPFKKLSKNETEDLQISTDKYYGHPWDKNNLINTGFYFVKSNNKTIALFEKWYSMRDNSTGLKEQDVLLRLIRGDIIEKLGLKIRFLDTLYFSGFCQNSKDFREVTTVHANCCRSINAKVKDLRVVLRDWKRYKKITSYKRLAGVNATQIFRWTQHNGCRNSWQVSNKTKVL